MSRTKTVIVRALASVALAASWGAPSHAQSGLYIPSAIVPGEFIGHLKLGEGAARQIRSMGAAAKSDTAPPYTVMTWKARNGNTTAIAIFQDPGSHSAPVREIRVTSSYFETREGIGPGSALSSVESAFPEAQAARHTAKTPYTGRIALLDDPAEGIAFEFPVTYGHLLPGARCAAVTIYPKGKSILNSSCPLYAARANEALQYNG